MSLPTKGLVTATPSELLEDAQDIYQRLDALNTTRVNDDHDKNAIADALESAAQLVDFLYMLRKTERSSIDETP